MNIRYPIYEGVYRILTSGQAHFPNSEQQSGAKVKFREDNL